MSQLKCIRVGDVDLESEVLGDGEPVLLIQTALTADELRPLAEQVVRRGGYQVILYHRRGYAGSGPSLRPGSVTADVILQSPLYGFLRPFDGLRRGWTGPAAGKFSDSAKIAKQRCEVRTRWRTCDWPSH